MCALKKGLRKRLYKDINSVIIGFICLIGIGCVIASGVVYFIYHTIDLFSLIFSIGFILTLSFYLVVWSIFEGYIDYEYWEETDKKSK